MGLFFGNLFWGILLVLWGISLILKGFGISLPLAKIFFAVIIILFGIKLLAGGSWKCKAGGIKTSSKYGATIEYTSVFSGQDIDLTHIKPGDKPVEITVVFGGAKVFLPSDVAFNIEPTTVFGSMKTPKQAYFGFGDNAQEFNESAKGEKVTIEATAVFGGIEFVIKEVKRQDNSTKADSTETQGAQF